MPVENRLPLSWLQCVRPSLRRHEHLQVYESTAGFQRIGGDYFELRLQPISFEHGRSVLATAPGNQCHEVRECAADLGRGHRDRVAAIDEAPAVGTRSRVGVCLCQVQGLTRQLGGRGHRVGGFDDVPGTGLDVVEVWARGSLTEDIEPPVTDDGLARTAFMSSSAGIASSVSLAPVSAAGSRHGSIGQRQKCRTVSPCWFST